MRVVTQKQATEDVDWIGLDWIGLDWIGLDWIGLDWFICLNKFGPAGPTSIAHHDMLSRAKVSSLIVILTSSATTSL